MKVKLCLFFLLLFSASQNVYSSGALRHILPFLSSITGGLREGEIAYDEINKNVVFKTDGSVKPLGVDTYVPEKFPEIISMSYINGSSQLVRHSDISAGNIKIKGKFYSNTSSISCAFDASSPTTGFGFFDGSTKPTSTPTNPAFFHPMYLYLVQDGDGFKCVHSYNLTGPESSLVGSRNWIRVQTQVGAVSEAHGGLIIKTVGTRSYVRNANAGMIEFFMMPGSHTAYEDAFFLTSSMKSVQLEGLTCETSETVSIEEKINTPLFTKFIKARNAKLADLYAVVGGCDGYIKPRGDAMEYIFSLSERKIYVSTTAYKPLRITEWTENQLTSN